MNDDALLVARFFAAIDRLIEDGQIARKGTFPDRYGINRRNFETLRKEPHRKIFCPSWLVYLVRDYGVSPRYLLTGEGAFYNVPSEIREKYVTSLSEILLSV